MGQLTVGDFCVVCLVLDNGESYVTLSQSRVSFHLHNLSLTFPHSRQSNMSSAATEDATKAPAKVCAAVQKNEGRGNILMMQLAIVDDLVRLSLQKK